MNVFELCGWVGAILVLIAYYMVSTGKAKGDSFGFQMINISGAFLLVLYTYNCKAYASMIVNIIWVAIGLTTFTRFIKLSSVKLGGRFIMKTKTKAILTLALMAMIAIAAPVKANTELYAQASDEDSVYDEEEGTGSEEVSTEKPAPSEESSEEESDEEY